MLESKLSSTRVILLDDEKKIIALIRKIIDWTSLDCVIAGEAYNGIAGMELIKAEKPDIVISDIKMPGLDGIALMRQLKDEMPDLLFIFISGYSEFEYAQSALNLGALGYVLKPLDKKQITELILKGITILRQREEDRALKIIASGGLEEYMDVMDTYMTNELYVFFNSDVEDRLVSAVKKNEKSEVLAILDDIFSKAEKSSLDFLHVKKLALEICRSFLKNFHTELNYSKNDINYAEGFKNCTQAYEIRNALTDYSIGMIENLKLHRNQGSRNVIEKVKSYIDENISGDISLQAMSQMVFMNPTYLSELFKKETGENFIDYITKSRVGMAKKLLANTTMKMEEIAGKVGYDRLEYFYRVFKKFEGVTPKEFRKLKS